MATTRLSRRDLLIQGGIRAAGLGAGSRIVLPHIIPLQTASTGKADAHPVTITVLEHQQLRLRLLKAEIPRFEAAMAARGTPIDGHRYGRAGLGGMLRARHGARQSDGRDNAGDLSPTEEL